MKLFTKRKHVRALLKEMEHFKGADRVAVPKDRLVHLMEDYLTCRELIKEMKAALNA